MRGKKKNQNKKQPINQTPQNHKHRKQNHRHKQKHHPTKKSKQCGVFQSLGYPQTYSELQKCKCYKSLYKYMAFKINTTYCITNLLH